MRRPRWLDHLQRAPGAAIDLHEASGIIRLQVGQQGEQRGIHPFEVGQDSARGDDGQRQMLTTIGDERGHAEMAAQTAARAILLEPGIAARRERPARQPVAFPW